MHTLQEVAPGTKNLVQLDFSLIGISYPERPSHSYLRKLALLFQPIIPEEKKGRYRAIRRYNDSPSRRHGVAPAHHGGRRM